LEDLNPKKGTKCVGCVGFSRNHGSFFVRGSGMSMETQKIMVNGFPQKISQLKTKAKAKAKALGNQMKM